MLSFFSDIVVIGFGIVEGRGLLTDGDLSIERSSFCADKS